MLEKFFEVPSILLFEPGMLLPFVMLGLLINSHLLPLRKIGELTEILFPLPFFISWQKLMPWKKKCHFSIPKSNWVILREKDTLLEIRKHLQSNFNSFLFCSPSFPSWFEKKENFFSRCLMRMNLFWYLSSSSIPI